MGGREGRRKFRHNGKRNGNRLLPSYNRPYNTNHRDKTTNDKMKRELTLADVVGYMAQDVSFEKQDEDGNVGLRRIYPPAVQALGKPVLRPISDLYVKITERGYNDGKPFIPIFRMAKIKYPEFTRFTHCDLDEERVLVSSPDSPITGWYKYDEEELSIGEYDLLHRLHLDYRGLIPAGLAVSVYDLLTNPYEA